MNESFLSFNQDIKSFLFFNILHNSRQKEQHNVLSSKRLILSHICCFYACSQLLFTSSKKYFTSRYICKSTDMFKNIILINKLFQAIQPKAYGRFQDQQYSEVIVVLLRVWGVFWTSLKDDDHFCDRLANLLSVNVSP